MTWGGRRRRWQLSSGGSVSAAQSSYDVNTHHLANDGVTTSTISRTYRNGSGVAVAGVPISDVLTACSVNVAASTTAIAATIETATDTPLTITLVDAQTGAPIPGYPSALLAGTADAGAGATFGSFSATTTNANGVISVQVQFANTGTWNVGATANGVAIVGTSLTVSGSSVLYPNQPGGLSAIAEMDPAVMGFSRGTAGDGSFTSMVSGVGIYGRSPIDLLTVTGSPAYLNYIWETGTPPGYNAAGSDNVGFNLGGTAFDGVSGPSYNTWYQSTTFNLYGAGTDFQTVLGPGVKILGYWGVTNQDLVHGPYQIYMVGIPVDPDSSTPALATEFSIRIYFQNGASYGPLDPNVVTDKYIVAGTQHQFEILMTAGTNGGNDGTIDVWLDNIHIHHWTNAPFLNSSYAQAPGTGLTPFWGWGASLVWGGSAGGPGDWTKTRDDAIRFLYTYISGA